MKYENVRKEFSHLISILVLKNGCKDYSKEDVDILLNLLKQCCNDDNTKPYMDIVNNLLNDRDFSTIYSEKNKIFIMNMIEKYASDSSLNKFAKNLITSLIRSEYIQNYSEEEIIKIISILDKFIDNIFIKSATINLTGCLIQNYCRDNCPKEKFKLPLTILRKCSDNYVAEHNILYIINKISEYYMKIGCFNEEIGPWLDILNMHAENYEKKDHIALMFRDFILKKWYKNCSKENMSKIMEILHKCISSDDAKLYILTVSGVLINTGYFAGDPEGTLKAINLMAECAVDYADLKVKTLKYIYILNLNYRFHNCSQAQSIAIVDILNKFVCDPKMTKYVLHNLSSLASRNALVNYPKAKASQLMDMLSKLIDNSKLPESELNDSLVASKVLNIALFLFHNGFLKEFSLEQIECMSEKCCNSESTKKYLVIANYFLTNGSKTTMSELTKTLNECLDEGGRESEVSYIVLNIVEFDHFKNCSQEEIKSLINILHRCSNGNSTHTRVLYSTARLIDRGLIDNCSKDQKKLLTEIIYGCLNSNNYNVQNCLIDTIGLLLKKNFFESNLTDIKPIFKFVEKCSYINKFKPRISMLVCKLIDNQLLINCSKSPIINILDRCVKRNEDNKFILRTIKVLCAEEVTGDLSSANISKLLEILEKCAAGKCDNIDSVRFLASAIKYLISRENWCMGNVSKYEAFRVMKLLDFCINHKNMNGPIYFFKPNIVLSVTNLTSKRLRQGLCEDEIEKIIDLLARCLDDPDAIIYVEYAFSVLVNDEFGDEIIKKIDILLKNDVNDSVKNNFMVVIYTLAKNNFMKNYNKNQISNVLKILRLCNKNNMAKLYIGNIILLLIANEYFKNCSKNEILQVLNLLKMCSDLEIVQDNAIFIIYRLIDDGLLKDSSNEEMSALMDMLSEVVKNAKIKIQFINIFDKLFATDCFKYEIGKTVDILEKIYKIDENHKNIINIIEKLIDNKCLNNATESEIARINDILIRNLENDQLRLGSLKCIHKLLVNNYLNNLPKDTTKKIINALNYTYGDCESKKLAANLLTFLAWRDCLSGWSEDEIFQIISILYKCSDAQDATENVLQAFVCLAMKKCFSGFSADKIAEIVESLDKFSNNTAAKPFVAKTIEQLAIYGSFKKYSKDEVSKIINIIGQCCSEENSRKFSANAIDQLASQGLIEQKYKNTLKNWWNIPSKY